MTFKSGQLVTPVGTVIGTTVKPRAHVFGHDLVTSCTLRSGERFEVISSDPDFTIIQPLSAPDSSPITCPTPYLEPWK